MQNILLLLGVVFRIFPHMLLEPSLCGRLYVLVAIITGELASCPLVIGPIFGKIQLARHIEGINKVMTNMRLVCAAAEIVAC